MRLFFCLITGFGYPGAGVAVGGGVEGAVDRGDMLGGPYSDVEFGEI